MVTVSFRRRAADKLGAVRRDHKGSFFWHAVVLTRETALVLVIGHRGASRAEQENTVAAFRWAEKMGTDGVELDVRLAPNGRLLVFHDPLPEDPRELNRISSFGEVLDACGSMLVNVEIKNNDWDPDFDPSMAIVEPVLAELRSRGDTDRWLISSFSLDTIDRCHAVNPQFATALLAINSSARLLDKIVERGHRAFHPRIDLVDATLVAQCRARGLALNTWVCDDMAGILALDALDVHGVITTVPGEALAALGRGPAESAIRPTRWETPA